MRSRLFSRRRHQRLRKGYTLVFFALILFALFALAALVIDLGIARLTQRQMQSAVDSAALEGLRNGRSQAQLFADMVFDTDGDLNPDRNSPDPRWQAMENARGSAGVDSNLVDLAQQFVQDPTSGTYLPQLQPNDGDEQAGDIVRGNYDDSAIQSAADLRFKQDYSSVFFAPDSDGSALLVRLRRSGEANEANVRSSGPKMPYLFGRGSLASRDTVGMQTQIGPGATIRATAIADARPAKFVGVGHLGTDDSEDDLPGALPIAFYWRSPTDDSNVSSYPQAFVTAEENQVRDENGAEIGIVTNANGIADVTYLGQSVASDSAAMNITAFFGGMRPHLPSDNRGYALVVTKNDNDSQFHVVGFVYVVVAQPDATTITFNPPMPTLQTPQPQLAEKNAGATFLKSLDQTYVDDPQFWSQHQTSPLNAPALVR